MKGTSASGALRVAAAWLVSALCAAAPGPARAEGAGQQTAERPAPQASPTPEAQRYEERVEVAGDSVLATAASTPAKVAVPLEKLPVSVSALQAPLLRAQDARVLGDALRNAAGVNVASGFGVFDFFTIRGFDSLSSGLVLTDGAFEPESSFYQLYNVSRVEVVRGPTASLYGANPLSGAVNLIRKQPLLGRFAEAQVSAGRFGTYEAQLDANLGSAGGRTALRLNGLYRESDQYREDKRSRVLAVNPALTFRRGERAFVAVNLELVDSSHEPDSGIPVLGDSIAPVPRTTSYQSPLDRSDQSLLRLRLDLEAPLGAKGALRGKLYYTDLDWESDGTLIVGASAQPPPGFVARSMTLLRDRQKLLGLRLEAVGSASTGRAAHQLLLGLEASRLLDEYTLDLALLPPTTLFAPVEVRPGAPVVVPGLRRQADARSLAVAPYLADQLALGKLRLLAALRLDTLDYQDPRSGTDRRDTRPSPLIGLLVEPGPGTSLYASYATAFAPASSLVVGEREPEQATQYEAGAKARLLGGRALVSGAVYQIEKENIAIPDATGLLRQAGTQRSRGAEAELQAELGGGVHALASYAFNDARLTRFSDRVLVSLSPPAYLTVDRSGNRAPFAPRNVLNLWVQREVGRGLGAGGGARYVCSQYVAEDNAFRIGSYWLFDAALSYGFGRLTARLNFKNLADRAYETRGFGGSSVIPADPFAVYATLRLALGGR